LIVDKQLFLLEKGIWVRLNESQSATFDYKILLKLNTQDNPSSCRLAVNKLEKTETLFSFFFESSQRKGHTIATDLVDLIFLKFSLVGMWDIAK